MPASIVVPSAPGALKKEAETASQDGTNSTVSSESEDFLLELDEIPQLLMFDMQKENADDVIKSLRDLTDLVRTENKHCSINLQELASCGGPSVVVLAMNKWKTHEEIQTIGCTCIFFLAFDFACRNALVKARGLDTIVSAMKAFPVSKGIQFAGCGAIVKTITLIGKQEADSLQAQNAARRFVHSPDSMSVILRAMIQFRNYSGFQAMCCEALNELASDDECFDIMVKPNVVNVVAATLGNHGDDKCCRFHADNFMSKVTSG